MPTVRKRGHSLALVHGARIDGKPTSLYLATLPPDGRIPNSVRKQAAEKASAAGADVSFDWPALEARARALSEQANTGLVVAERVVPYTAPSPPSRRTPHVRRDGMGGVFLLGTCTEEVPEGTLHWAIGTADAPAPRPTQAILARVVVAAAWSREEAIRRLGDEAHPFADGTETEVADGQTE